MVIDFFFKLRKYQFNFKKIRLLLIFGNKSYIHFRACGKWKTKKQYLIENFKNKFKKIKIWEN